MTFDEVLAQVKALLQQEQRVSYRGLKRRFALDDEYLEDLKEELIGAKRLATDEDGRFLVWTGGTTAPSDPLPVVSPSLPTPSSQHPDAPPQTLNMRQSDGERRQLSVLFCDLVDSTKLSEQLDPEEYREVVRAYHETCAGVIDHYGGHTAQHLGDGLLVYFSYPAAHEDDAQRAVRTGLEILAGLQTLNARLQPAIKAWLPHPIQVRIGIHTGLVVIGEIGSSEKREILALGETPNIAARLQGLAEPDTVVISGATYRLVQGLFECQDRGSQELKGLSTPLPVYRVVHESEAQSRFEVTVRTGLTPLVGRDEELGLLLKRWERVKTGEGQVVLLSGEAGIGKSRLAQELKERITREGLTRIEFQCSPYYQNSALYPVIEHLQRLLQFQRDDSPHAKLEKLAQYLASYQFLQADTVPLLTALFSLPHPDRYPPLTLTPQRQKQKTMEALMAWLLEETEKTAVYCAWEDLHWADPSTLEFLSLIIDQVPAARMLILLTCRPEFSSPWGTRSHLTQITLSRLSHKQVEEMVKKVTGSKALPFEVLQQVVSKTDGVPLFVEELTKAVVESGLLQEVNGYYELTGPLPPLAIPVTLRDSLMARLDRLATVREVAQVGATLGREFSYELIQAVSPLDEERLQKELTQLVEAEFFYQRGLPPRARYIFKHALIQDAAYQSLLKSKRQHYHQQIAQVLEQRFPETKETQPELLAHHYTEAGLIEQALPYWQQAGQRASQRSANVEAVSHLSQGLELLKTVPDTPDRSQHELRLQIALGAVLIATKGFASPAARQAYARARELCEQVEDTPQLVPVLYGLCTGYMVAGQHKTSHELAEQLLDLAHRQPAPTFLLPAHTALGMASFFLGEPAVAREHLEQAIALYDPQRDNPQVSGVAQDLGAMCRVSAAMALWPLGYPDQALKRIQEALTLARELTHPYSLAYALGFAARVHQLRQEGQRTHEQAEAAITLCTDQGFPLYLAVGTILRGWALAEQGQEKDGIAQIRQGLAGLRATGAEVFTPYYLALLAETYGRDGQAGEGLTVVGEALAIVDKNEERWWEAELYRLKGELTLQQCNVQGSKFKVEESSEAEVKTSLGQVKTSQDKSTVSGPRPLAPDPQSEAEACFLKAIEIAQRQQAKSLELRAVMSLAKLWQRQGKQTEAHEMLAAVYNWFTEGFDTKDLQEAKVLLDELS